MFAFPVGAAQVSFQAVSSRRVMMPAYIAEYKVFGNSFYVSINGATGESC